MLLVREQQQEPPPSAVVAESWAFARSAEQAADRMRGAVGAGLPPFAAAFPRTSHEMISVAEVVAVGCSGVACFVENGQTCDSPILRLFLLHAVLSWLLPLPGSGCVPIL